MASQIFSAVKVTHISSNVNLMLEGFSTYSRKALEADFQSGEADS
jgi:hypothetical protein